MKAVSVGEMRALEQKTILEAKISGEELMDRAGYGLARTVHRLIRNARRETAQIYFIAGTGNNGGDAFAAARYTSELGFITEVWLAGDVKKVQGDARVHLYKLKPSRVVIREYPKAEDWASLSLRKDRPAIIVDGLLGTGSAGAPRDTIAAAIGFVNKQLNEALVVSIDIPSGLDADSGQLLGSEAVVADVTATMALPKKGLLAPCAVEYVGNIEVVDIGIPAKFIAAAKSEETAELITAADIIPLFPRRKRTAHKGDFGRVLLIGGAQGYVGAIAMAAKAALRSGAGLVSAIVPDKVAPIVASLVPEVMVHWAPSTDIGSLGAAAAEQIIATSREHDALLIGPGMTSHNDSKVIVQRCLREITKPLVIDADAINVLSGKVNEMVAAKCPVIMTPHPVELARLMGWEKAAPQSERLVKAKQALEQLSGTLVLKGAGTIVLGPGYTPAVNLTGNPGMATGGSGDVLSGMIVGLLGQGLSPYNAARAAVYLHGRAGDRVAYRGSQAGLIATDLIEELPALFREVSAR